MKLSAPDYIAALTRLGLVSDAADVPEFNTAFWREYLALYRTHIGDPADIECVVSPQGAGFYRDPLAEAAHYSWALLGPVSHVPVPFGAAALVALGDEIAATFATDGIPDFIVQTDSFSFADTPAAADVRYFAWLHSPQAAIATNLDSYAQSLTASRRKQMRRLYRTYNDDPAFRFELSGRLPDSAEIDFILRNCRARWGIDEHYALVQVLWAVAAGRARPEAARFMRVYCRDRLVFLNTYLVRGDTIVAQSTTRGEGEMFSGLGTMIDFKTIETLSGSPAIRFLDPTCRTGLDDPESIGVAKREVVTTDRLRPLLLMGEAAPSLPYYKAGAGWIVPPAAEPLGRAL